MKDRVFSGASVDEAVATAGQALGLPREALRYVVLDGGSPGGRGISPTPARIAVLLESPGGEGPVASSRGASREGEPGRDLRAEAAERDPRPAVRQALRLFAEAAGVDLAVDSEETADTVHVRLSGPGCDVLLEEEGEVFRAMEHVLQRTWRGRDPRRLSLECVGYRAGRDATLADKAHALAAAVRADGRARTTEPLNAYERRIVHMALGAEADLETFSVGEEGRRRVTVALRGTRGASTEAPPGAAGSSGRPGPEEGGGSGGPDRG